MTGDLVDVSAKVSGSAHVPNTGVNSGGSRPATALSLKVVYLNDLPSPTAGDGLVQRLLGSTTLATMYGAPKTGKSFLATDLAFHIVRAARWYGRRVEGGGVLIVAAEGHAGYLNRLHAFRKVHDVRGDVPLAAIPQSLTLTPDSATVEAIVAEAAAMRAKFGVPVVLIIIDTLARTIDGNESETQDMSAFVRACDQLRERTGACVMVIHHAGKEASRGARGSTALIAASDTVIRIDKPADGPRLAVVEEQKDGAAGDTFAFQLRPVDIGIDKHGDPITSAVVDHVGEGAPAKAKFSAAKRRELEIISDLIARHGRDPGHPHPHIPAGRTCVTEDEWRAHRYSRTPDNKPAAKQKAFRRAFNELLAAGKVGKWNEWVWLV